MASPVAAIQVKPLAFHLGAEISGVDLGRPLAAGVRDAVWRALLDWKVVFFRGQNLDHAGHIAFARQMGDPTVGHPVFGHVEGFPEVYSVATRRATPAQRHSRLQRPWSGWHTDLTAAHNPPKAAILRAETVPAYGGDTLWCDLAAAYNGLSETMRRILDGLRGVHRFELTMGAAGDPAYDAAVKRRAMTTEHPLVTVHPETGERLLFVSPSLLKGIVSLSRTESDCLLEMLWTHMARPDYTVRFKWEAGDVAMWDNRATAHLAPTDMIESDHVRQLYRITLAGDVPVGVDGRPSIAHEGAPILPVARDLAAGD